MTESYSVMQIGIRTGDDYRVLLTLPDGDTVSARVSDDRISLASTLIGTVRAKLAQWRGEQLFGRVITGHDETFDSGLLAGSPIRLKEPRPTVVTEQADWTPLDL